MTSLLRDDWPTASAPIDLSIHDLPHSSSSIEWWYFNSHLRLQSKNDPKTLKDVSIFCCFFTFAKGEGRSNSPSDHTQATSDFNADSQACALNCAIVDSETKEYLTHSLLDKDIPSFLLKMMNKSSSPSADPLITRALKDVLNRGQVPLPDRLFTKKPFIKINGNKNVLFDFQDAKLNLGNGSYQVDGNFDKHNFFLNFTPLKKPVRHGNNGIVQTKPGDEMYYYFIPRCEVTGSVTINGEEYTVQKANSLGWYDHEFGGVQQKGPSAPVPVHTNGNGRRKHSEIEEETKGNGVKSKKEFKGHVHHAWTWFACQLEGGYDVTAFEMFAREKNAVKHRRVIVIGPDGEERRYEGDQVRVMPVLPEQFIQKNLKHEEESQSIFDDKQRAAAEKKAGTFVSLRTFLKYPTKWKITVDEVGLELFVEASFADQEFITLLTRVGYWEGRCSVNGKLDNNSSPLSGLGFVERNGYASLPSLSKFFGAVGEEVRKSARKLYPDAKDLTDEHAQELIASDTTGHYMQGVDKTIFAKTLLEPVRRVIDRGGKSWRSYGFLACCDVVGGDARKWSDLLAMPEFLHVGSLLVDDIQDESEIRRGGPCAHKIYGNALTINAGTAAYFLFERLISKSQFTEKEIITLYDLYFACLRAGHAGQGLDINGLDYMMEQVIKTGEGKLLQDRVLAIHRLKTAIPAGSLAQMGAIAGKGSAEQIKAVGLYYESIGVAFQIMDDVLNLRGLYHGKADLAPEQMKKRRKTLKTLGEDIMAGKVTIPVAKAMCMLDKESDRRALWESIKCKPQAPTEVAKVIARLEELGAIDECVKQAHELVETAWRELDRYTPHSQAKLMLRAFGWFIVER